MNAPTCVITRFLLPAALVLGVGCTANPQAHRIAGADGKTPAYHILFLGAGFETDDQLEAYRAAADALANAMLTDDTFPYRDYASHLSFWRIDVRSGPIGTSTCGVSTTAVKTGPPCSHEVLIAPPPTAAPAPIETVNPSGDAVVDEDLHVSLCYTETASPGPCTLVWATDDGQRKAAELAAAAGDIDVVVILANTQLAVGATKQHALSGGQGLVVIGVPQDAAGAAEGFNLLAHELAHTLDLADEYTEASGLPATSASDYGNVWEFGDTCYVPDSTIPDKPSGTALKIPWSALLDCGASLDPTYDCDYTKADHACPVVWYPSHTSDLSCPPDVRTVPRTTADEYCKGHVGLFEGAFYATEGIYRPMWTCKMHELSASFCSVCDAWIRNFFECNYIDPTKC